MAFTSIKVTNKTYNFKQAIKEEDRSDFLDTAGMAKEINDHSEQENWELQLRYDLPPGKKTTWSIWSFKPTAVRMFLTDH